MPARYWQSLVFTVLFFLGIGLVMVAVNQWQPTHKPVILKPVAVNLALFQSPKPPAPAKVVKTVKPVHKPIKKKVKKPVKPIIKKTSTHKIHPKQVKKTHPKKVHPKVTPPKKIVPAKPELKTLPKPTPTPNPAKKIAQPIRAIPKAIPSNKPQYSKQAIASAEQTYLQALVKVLGQGAKDSYPNFAKYRHWEGTVILKFTLLPNGKIVATQIKQSANRKVFNEAALSIIHEAMQDRFKPFPKQIQRTQWTIQVPIEYRLEN